MMQNVLTNLRSLGRSIKGFFLRLGWWKSLTLIVILVIALMVARSIFGGPDAVAPEQLIRQVEVRSIADLSSETTPLAIVGEVTSRSEATVRSESSGEVIGVYRSLGDSVSAGTIVAELENASQRAAVLQAQGVVDAAQAALDKVQKGTRSEQLSILQSAHEGAKSGAVNALLSAYTSVDSAILGTTDTFFINPTSQVPKFKVQTSNSELRNRVENQRATFGSMIARQQNRAVALNTSDDLIKELGDTEVELRNVRNFLDNIIGALNAAIATSDYPQATINTYIASATGARTAVNAALASLSSARTALQTAVKNLEQGVSGAQVEDVAASQASLKQAQGALAAARANLEKSIIRSPISGTINSFSLKRGDFVGPSQEVLTVANNGALEVVAYVTEQDARDLTVGSRVSIEGGVTGSITRIAPALDPLTKRIEVRIGVGGNVSSLINGQSVTVSITRVNRSIGTASARMTVPISAIKVGSDNVVIFTVADDGTLVPHEVVLGALLGERVVIESGATPDMEIVTDARGLREGQTVEVK